MFFVFTKQRALVVINKPSDEELLSTFLHKGVSVRNWLDACIADQGISRGTVTTFAIFNTQRTAKKGICRYHDCLYPTAREYRSLLYYRR